MYYPYLIISWLKRFEIPICALAELIGAQGWDVQIVNGVYKANLVRSWGAGIALLCFPSLFFISPTFPMIMPISHSIFLCTDIRAPAVCLLCHSVNIVISHSYILHHFPDICVRNTLTSTWAGINHHLVFWKQVKVHQLTNNHSLSVSQLAPYFSFYVYI